MIKPIVSFDRQHKVVPGKLETLTPTLRRLTAPNAGPYTFHGTGTLIVGRGDVAVIDPGPAIPNHIDALLESLGDEKITHILVTHTHLDHSPGCKLLQQHIDAPTYGFGVHGYAGPQVDLGTHPSTDACNSDEGGDLEFAPDIEVIDGQVITGEDWQLECLHTPGHAANHLCFSEERTGTLFSGDHVMAWSTSVVSPPDGEMGAYMGSLERLLERTESIYWPIHGGAVRSPHAFVLSLIEHRKNRETEVLRSVEAGVKTVEMMVPVIYQGLDKALFPAAARSLFATVIYLVEQGSLATDEAISISANYHIA